MSERALTVEGITSINNFIGAYNIGNGLSDREIDWLTRKIECVNKFVSTIDITLSSMETLYLSSQVVFERSIDKDNTNELYKQLIEHNSFTLLSDKIPLVTFVVAKNSKYTITVSSQKPVSGKLTWQLNIKSNNQSSKIQTNLDHIEDNETKEGVELLLKDQSIDRNKSLTDFILDDHEKKDLEFRKRLCSANNVTAISVLIAWNTNNGIKYDISNIDIPNNTEIPNNPGEWYKTTTNNIISILKERVINFVYPTIYKARLNAILKIINIKYDTKIDSTILRDDKDVGVISGLRSIIKEISKTYTGEEEYIREEEYLLHKASKPRASSYNMITPEGIINLLASRVYNIGCIRSKQPPPYLFYIEVKPAVPGLEQKAQLYYEQLVQYKTIPLMRIANVVEEKIGDFTYRTALVRHVNDKDSRNIFIKASETSPIFNYLDVNRYCVRTNTEDTKMNQIGFFSNFNNVLTRLRVIEPSKFTISITKERPPDIAELHNTFISHSNVYNISKSWSTYINTATIAAENLLLLTPEILAKKDIKRSNVAPADLKVVLNSRVGFYIVDEVMAGRIALNYINTRNQINADPIVEINNRLICAFNRGLLRMSAKGKGFSISTDGINKLTFNPNGIEYGGQVLSSDVITLVPPKSLLEATEDLCKELHTNRFQKIIDNSTVNKNDQNLLPANITNTLHDYRGDQESKAQGMKYFMFYPLAGKIPPAEIKNAKENNLLTVELVPNLYKMLLKLAIYNEQYNQIEAEDNTLLESLSKERSLLPGEGYGYHDASINTPDQLDFNTLANRYIDLLTAPYIAKTTHHSIIKVISNNLDEDNTYHAFNATIGEISVKLSIINQQNNALRYYINDIVIRKDEINQAIKKSLCFTTQEAYDKYLKQISIISIRARDLMDQGLNIATIIDRAKNNYSNIVLEFTREERHWYLIIRNADNTIYKKHLIPGGINKFVNLHSSIAKKTRFMRDHNLILTAEDILEYLKEIPSVGFESFRKLVTTGTKIIDERIARSRKLLEDTINITKASFTNCTYGSKTIGGYKVRGSSGREYVVACTNLETNPNLHGGTEKFGSVYALPQLSYICIVDKSDQQSGYDMIVNRLLALKNDKIVVRDVGTLSSYTNNPQAIEN